MKMTDSVGVCVYVPKDSDVNSFIDVISNAMDNSNCCVRFYIYCANKDLNEFCSALCEDFADKERKEVYFIEGGIDNRYLAINTLIKNVQEDYACILPYDIFVENLWLEKLIIQSKRIPTSGVIAIRSNEKAELSSYLDSDEKMCFVWLFNDSYPQGVMLVKMSLIKIVGAFHGDLIGTTYETQELCSRISVNGFLNYYAFGLNSIKTSSNEKRSVKNSSKYLAAIAEMNKNNCFKTTL